MNKRKLQRSNKKKQQTQDDKIMSITAEKTARAALEGKASIDCLGNFIFFSIPEGYAWMLDHRRAAALRLADNGEKAPYIIIENKEKFRVEWKERFRIEGEQFIVSSDGKETVFEGCPTDAISGFITMLKTKNSLPM